MVETKPSCPPEENQLNNLTDKNKGKSPKSKKFRGSKTQTKSQVPEPEAETYFKGKYSDLEGYIFTLVPRASDKFFIEIAANQTS